MEKFSIGYLVEKRRRRWRGVKILFTTIYLAFWIWITALMSLDWALCNIRPETHMLFVWIPLTIFAKYCCFLLIKLSKER